MLDLCHYNRHINFKILFSHHSSFGVLFVGFKEQFPSASNATVSGSGSLAFSLIHFAAPLTTCFIEFGVSVRKLVFIGGLLVASGCIVTAFVKVRYGECTMVGNGKKHKINSHLIIHCPTSEGVSEVSERASK